MTGRNRKKEILDKKKEGGRDRERGMPGWGMWEVRGNWKKTEQKKKC